MFADQNLSPVREFFDTDSTILASSGRAAVYESYGFDEKPIVVKCRTMGASGQSHEAIYADVGYFKEVSFIKEIEIPGAGKAKPTIEEHEGVEYQVKFRAFDSEQTFDGDTVDRETALQFAVDMALACYGENFNYLVDLQNQPRPTLNQTRDVLVKYGLVDEKKLPPKRAPKRQQTHGGRGVNKATAAEIENLTGARVGA